MSKVIAVFNQKGGVGKTTTNVNLSACIAVRGKKVLVVDIDPQGNTTSGLGIDKKELKKTIYDVLIGTAKAEEVITQTAVENLSIIPSSANWQGRKLSLQGLKKGKKCSKSPGRNKGRIPICFYRLSPFTGASHDKCPSGGGQRTDTNTMRILRP